MGDDARIRSKLAENLAGSALISVTIGYYKSLSAVFHYLRIIGFDGSCSHSMVPVHIRWRHLIETRESLGISTEQHLIFYVSTRNTSAQK
jgi:hypothetical protein